MGGRKNFGLRGVKPVLLCGGKGTRLWPLSSKTCPKQFVRDPLIAAVLDQPVDGDGRANTCLSMFQLTLKRCEDAGFSQRPLIVATAQYRDIVCQQLQEVGIHADILFEPKSADTAMAIAVATEFICQKYGSIDALFLPCDHYIDPVSAFAETIKNGMQFSSEGKLVSFGIPPTRASTNYGYIAPLHRAGFHDVQTPQSDYQVDAFIEKPNTELARQLVEDGNYWNSGIFLSNSFVLHTEISRRIPDIAGFACTTIEALARLGGEMMLEEEPYQFVRKISFDRAVMERTRLSHMIVAKFSWRDLGGWNAVAEVLKKDEAQNSGVGKYVVVEGARNFVCSSNRLVVLNGVSDLSVIDRGNTVVIQPLYAPVHESATAGTLVAKLQEGGFLDEPVTGSSESSKSLEFDLMPKSFPKPWGCFEVLQVGKGYQVKRLVVKSGGRLSLQRHQSRNEHWVVVAGKGRVTCNAMQRELKADDTISIKSGDVHRLENMFDETLELIEVQTGTYLGEDDIERFDDDYDRA